MYNPGKGNVPLGLSGICRRELAVDIRENDVIDKIGVAAREEYKPARFLPKGLYLFK